MVGLEKSSAKVEVRVPLGEVSEFTVDNLEPVGPGSCHHV